MKERRHQKEATEAQKAAAELSVYLDAANLIKKKAKEHTGRRTGRRYKRTRKALLDLYFIREHDFPEEQFRERWGEQSYTFDTIFDELTPELQTIKEKTEENASSLTVIKRMRIAAKAATHLKKLPTEQRQELLAMTGYTKDELKTLGKKLTLSGIGTAATLPPVLATVGAVTTKEKLDPWFDLDISTLPDTKMLAFLLGSYVAHYGSIYLASKANHLLLDYRDSCPNLWATGMYLLTKKIFPEDIHLRLLKKNVRIKKETVHGGAVNVGTFSPAVTQELAVVPTIAVPHLGPQVVFARNIAGVMINTTEAAVDIAYYGYRKLQERRNRKREKTTPNSDQ